jgi:HKD family nuclease
MLTTTFKLILKELTHVIQKATNFEVVIQFTHEPLKALEVLGLLDVFRS